MQLAPARGSGSCHQSLHDNPLRLDRAIAEQVVTMIKPAELQLAWEALRHLEARDEAIMRQWRMRLERAEYEVQLAERRYHEVDPSHRLVAATLERRWNDSLQRLDEIKQQYAETERREARAVTPEQKAQVLALAQNFPRLWNASTTQAKDRKRMVRLLIKDLTVERHPGVRQAVMHVRWQGGACTEVQVALPPPVADQVRYPREVIHRVRALARELPDDQLVERLNPEQYRSATGQLFRRSMIPWIHYRYGIPRTQLKRPEELTVRQVAEHFGVSWHVVYYWTGRGALDARRVSLGKPYWITLTAMKEQELWSSVHDSTRIQKLKNA